jgi:hypothetical protein
MANDTAGLFQTLTIASSMATEHLKFQNTFLSSVYGEHRPIQAATGETFNILVPTVDMADVQDVGDQGLTFADSKHTNTQVQITNNFASSWIVKNWTQVRSPVDLARLYIAPKIEGLLRRVNYELAALVTTTNFSTHSITSGSGADVFDRADPLGAWTKMANVGAPVDDMDNMFFITNPAGYAALLGDSDWTQESIVGASQAQQATQFARLRMLFGANVKWDQQLAAYNSGKIPAVLMHRAAIAMMTALPVSVPEEFRGQSTIINYVNVGNGITVKLESAYSMERQGLMMSAGFAFGCKVARPEYGALVETA